MMEILHIGAKTDASQVVRVFWAIADEEMAQPWGEVDFGGLRGPLAIRFAVGHGSMIVVLTALERKQVASLLEFIF